MPQRAGWDDRVEVAVLEKRESLVADVDALDAVVVDAGVDRLVALIGPRCGG